MKNRIYKYALEWEQAQKVMLPRGARLLNLQIQEQGDGSSVPCLWCSVDVLQNENEQHLIKMVVTGGEDPSGVYLGTVQNGPYVFHFFDLG